MDTITTTYTNLPETARKYGLSPADAARFWSKVAFGSNPKGCWTWEGALSPTGYAKFKFRRPSGSTSWPVHRVALVLMGHEPPYWHGYEVDHLCRVRNCVSPSHLQFVTRTVNHTRAMRAKGTSVAHHEFDPIPMSWADLGTFLAQWAGAARQGDFQETADRLVKRCDRLADMVAASALGTDHAHVA